MSKTLCSLLGTGLLCAVFQLSAQAPEPPKVLRIIREDIKEGKASAHEKTEMKFAQTLTKIKFPASTLAMTSMSGLNQAWFLEPHETFASIGDVQAVMEKNPELDTLDALDSEYRSSSRVTLAVYRPDLSYHGTQLMEGLPKSRYFNVITIRIRFEHDQEFAELAKTAVAAAEKAENDQPVAVYQVVSGGPAGTYILFEPAATLKALDEGQARSRALMQAMGESNAKKFLKSAGEIIAGEESLLFAFNPKMSYVSKEFAAGDPDFWTPKPAKTVTKAKPAEKTSAAK